MPLNEKINSKNFIIRYKPSGYILSQSKHVSHINYPAQFFLSHITPGFQQLVNLNPPIIEAFHPHTPIVGKIKYNSIN